MTVLERIKQTCREKKNISITVLEQELKYSNGSLAKAKDIPSSRISEISKFLDVSMDYIMTGNEPKMASFTEQGELLVKIRNDKRLFNAIEKYYSLSDRKKEHVLDLIELLGGEAKI